MELSILISKILAVGYLSLGVGILFNQDYYKEELTKMIDNSSVLIFGGFIALVMGFLMIEYHNTWQKDWTTMITIIGWIALIKGIMILAFPNHISFYKNTIFASESLFKFLLPLLFIVGGVFAYFGFFYRAG